MDEAPQPALERIAAKARWLRFAAKRLLGKAARIDAQIEATELKRDPEQHWDGERPTDG